mgnify:CR=1 FL=1
MEELFKEFDKLNTNNNFTLTIMYTKYLEWSITIIDEGNGWDDARIVSDVYDTDKATAIKKAIEKIKNYKKPIDK